MKFYLQRSGQADDSTDSADVLVSRLRTLRTDLRTLDPDDVADWIGSDDAHEAQLEDPVRENYDRLAAVLDDLAAVNEQLRQSVTPTLQEHPELLANSLPKRAVSDGWPPKVAYSWQGCQSVSNCSAYDWLIGCGYALVTAETPDDLVERLRAQTQYPDVAFSLADWEDLDIVKGWEDDLWAARSSDSVTVWSIVEENEALLRRQQGLVDEVYTILAELSESLEADLDLPGGVDEDRSTDAHTEPQSPTAPETTTQVNQAEVELEQ